MAKAPQLHVVWTKSKKIFAPQDSVLSFLPPADEEQFHVNFKGNFIFAREASMDVRQKAREVYLRMSAVLAATKNRQGCTLRKDLFNTTSANCWWYHPSASKDNESDPAFGLIIAILTIQEVQKRLPNHKLVFWGAPKEITKVFSGKSMGFFSNAFIILRALMARLRSAYQLILERKSSLSVKWTKPPKDSVLFFGFWDWSVAVNSEGSLSDRYAKALPHELGRHGLTPAWLCWLDLEGDPSKQNRPWKSVMTNVNGRRDIELLQSHLTLTDIVRAYFQFSPILVYARWRSDPDFKSLFIYEGLNLFPLFDGRLLRGFLDGCIARCHLIALSTKRACQMLHPVAVISFLEHNTTARAFYHGVRQNAQRTTIAAFQHASLCAEKTFYFMDPALEFKGEPDNLAAPCPDVIFAMGKQSRQHFLSCGYPESSVVTTGNPRYDSLQIKASNTSPHNGLNILIAASLDTSVEIDMVEALCEATKELSSFNIILRNHPFSLVSDHPRFKHFSHRVKISSGSLVEDLARADIILFTYSTVAEEAFLQGKTVWQWRPLSYDASALSEVFKIPRFFSTAQLKQALIDFTPFDANTEDIDYVEEQLFYRLDGQAATRVAEGLVQAINLKTYNP